MAELSANSEAFRQNNEKLHRLIDQTNRGELTRESFHARADALLVESDALQERRRELKATYDDAIERRVMLETG
jgi:hypothetical protein